MAGRSALEIVRVDGETVVRNTAAPAHVPPTVPAMLARAAAAAPDRPFVVETAPHAPDRPQRVLTYGEAARDAERLAHALRTALGPADRPLVLALPPGIDHARLALAAMAEGRTVVPASPAVFAHRDPDRLRLLQGIAPAAVVVPSGALAGAAATLDAPVWALADPDPPARPATEILRYLPATHPPLPPPDPGAACKLLLTSGSTGAPKAVVQTHRMLAANQGMLAAILPELCETPPRIVDWLPWSHTFGGNHDLHLVLAHAGTLVVDEGPAADPSLERRLARLAAFGPTAIFDVPRVFDGLVAAWERDATLAARCLGRAQVVFYAGAALTPDTFARLARLVARHGPAGAFVSCGWGATETGPLVTAVPRPLAARRTDPRGIGIPAPGAAVRLAATDAGTELWVRSPAVAPAYRLADGTSHPVPDADGWFHTGDAGGLVDPSDPAAGLVLGGRIAENFKLGTGTWVPAAEVRAAVLDALRPLARHVVPAAPNAPYLSALVFVDPAAARALAGPKAPDPVASGPVAAFVRGRLARLAEGAGGSSRTVRAVALLRGPPDPAAGEITDKGYVNAARVRQRRRAALEAVYDGAACPDAVVVRLPPGPQSST